MTRVALKVNGRNVSRDVDGSTLLVELLRDGRKSTVASG